MDKSVKNQAFEALHIRNNRFAEYILPADILLHTLLVKGNIPLKG